MRTLLMLLLFFHLQHLHGSRYSIRNLLVSGYNTGKQLSETRGEHVTVVNRRGGGGGGGHAGGGHAGGHSSGHGGGRSHGGSNEARGGDGHTRSPYKNVVPLYAAGGFHNRPHHGGATGGTLNPVGLAHLAVLILTCVTQQLLSIV